MSITETKKPDFKYFQLSYVKEYKDDRIQKTTELDQKVKKRYAMFCKIAENAPNYNQVSELNLYKRLSRLSDTACKLSKTIPEDASDLPSDKAEKKFRKMIRVARSIALFVPKHINAAFEAFKGSIKSRAVKSEEREIRELVKYDGKSSFLRMDEMVLSKELSEIVSLMDKYIDGNYQEAKIYKARKTGLDKGEPLSGQPLSELHQEEERVALKSEIERRVSRFTKRLESQSERDERLIELDSRRSSRSLKTLPLEGKFEKFLKREVDLAHQRQCLILPQLKGASKSFKENEEDTLERLKILDAKLASRSKKYTQKNWKFHFTVGFKRKS